MKHVLYMHCGSGNHGCEALVRTTSMLLDGPRNVQLWSFSKKEDEKYGTSEQLDYIFPSEEIKRFSPAYFEALFKRKVLRRANATFSVFLKEIFRGNVAISIGGDNYCYPWSARDLIEWNKTIRRYAKKTVLWGCSIDPEAITPEMAQDLAKYDLITARESLTYELLKTINPHTQLVADPAFLLPAENQPLPKEFFEGNTVGINISPMIMDYSADRATVIESYSQLIRYILECTNMNVALIPHVVWDQTDDRVPLRKLYDEYAASGRVCLLDDADAMALKGYISRCRLFIGARTHATIAAYSTCVPTLVVGYSVKSRGIAKDLFGTHEKYVLPVQQIQDSAELNKHFRWMMENEDTIRRHLADIMPEYTEKARSAAGHYTGLFE